MKPLVVRGLIVVASFLGAACGDDDGTAGSGDRDAGLTAGAGGADGGTSGEGGSGEGGSGGEGGTGGEGGSGEPDAGHVLVPDAGQTDDGGVSDAGADPEPVSYELGDTGPAGGLIFFVDVDDQYSSFTYLEAAPDDLETAGGSSLFTWAAVYGGEAMLIGATASGIGAGATNTVMIANALDNAGQTGRAAQRVRDLELNGYDDWFLPSESELDLMYENLHQEGLGGFQSNSYWSSTEANINQAMSRHFSLGTKTAFIKTNAYRVRPARAL